VLPYFSPQVVIFWILFSTWYFENVMLGGAVALALIPIYNLFNKADNYNIAAENERNFNNTGTRMFMVSMIMTVMFDVLLNFYYLSMYSTKWRPEIPYIYDYVP